MATSPTQRTMRELRNQGRVCAIVEKWNQHVGPYGIRQDLFGIIDVIALDPQRGVVGIQSCGSNFSEHVNKFHNERWQECVDWLSTPGTSLELWGWRKVKLQRGGKAMRWQPRVQEFKLEDFVQEVPDGGRMAADRPSPDSDEGDSPLHSGVPERVPDGRGDEHSRPGASLG